MSKAEDRALEVYPPKLVTYSDLFGEETLDDNGPKRIIFVEGYRQAEKDLALTIEDIKLIIDIVDSENLKPHLFDEIDYQEVLNRFNKKKGK